MLHRRHLGRLAVVLVVAAVVATCVESSGDRCGDGSVCPEATQCRVLDALTTCVSGPQLDACKTLDQGSACTVGARTGTCLGGACYPEVCGDLIVDREEACDDGARIDGDGCSANCKSLERCGDSLIDLGLGEQCDDGVVGLSGDGCSSACTSELDYWTNRTPRDITYRNDSSFATDPLRGVVLYGGTLGSNANDPSAPVTDETWRWHVQSFQPLTPPTGTPPRRTNAAMSYDPLRHRVVMFGGRDQGGVALDDLWEWDGIAWTQRIASGGPSTRANATMACFPGRCVVFGGRSGLTDYDETYVWDGVAWSKPALNASPPRRAGAALAYDPDRQVLVLFGGITKTGWLNDTWELGVTAATWTSMSPLTPPAPAPSVSAAFDERVRRLTVLSSGQAYTYDGAAWVSRASGGVGAGKLAFDRQGNRLLAFGDYKTLLELTNAGWQTLSSFRPNGLQSGSLATYDPLRGRMLVIEGGRTFAWDGSAWSLVPTTTTTNPSVVLAAMVFDRKCDQAVVFGGGGGSNQLRDLWTFNGTAWTKTTPPLPPAGPAARGHHAMTYDTKRDAIVMFGGEGTTLSPARNDTWELRGPTCAKEWVEITTTPKPPPRVGAAMAYDPVRGVSVLFGGLSAASPPSPLGDTWEWDGTTWTDKTTSPSPDPRGDAAMTYDPRHKAIVLYGGVSGSIDSDETWRWDGVTWTRIPVLISPPARSGMNLSQDITGNVVMFGGETTGNVMQIWRLVTSTTAGSTELCRVASDDLDHDGLSGCADPDCGTRCKPLCVLGVDCVGPSCGDGVCSPVEDYVLCDADCDPP